MTEISKARKHFEELVANALKSEEGKADFRQSQEHAQKFKEVINAISQGKMPTTEQTTAALNKMNINVDTRQHNISETGKKALEQFNEAIDGTSKLIGEKNAGDHLQNIIQGSANTTQGINKSSFTDTKNISLEHAKGTKQLLNEGGENVVSIAKLIIKSSEFRKLLGDFYQLFEHIFSSQIPDHPGDRNFDSGVHVLDSVDKNSPPINDIKDNDITNNTKTLHPDDLKDKELSPNEALNSAKGLASDSAHPVGKSLMNSLKSNFTKSKEGDFSNIKEETRTAANQISDALKNNSTKINISPEMRTHFIERFRNLMAEIQSNEDYKNAILNLFDIISNINEQTLKYGKNLSSTASQGVSKEHTSNVTQHSKQLIENFAGETSLDPLIEAIKEMQVKIRNDQTLSNSIHSAIEFVRKSLINHEFLESDNYENEANEIFDKNIKILKTDYRQNVDRVLDEAKNFNSALQEDPTTNKFVKNFETLGQTLFMDENGKPTIKRELVNDIRYIIPLLAQKLKYLRLPRIEFEDEKQHVILDNVVLECEDLLPNSIYLRTDTEFELKDDQMLNALTVRIKNINGRAKNVAFYVNIKKGMIKPEEAGYIDVDLPKEGVTLDLTLAPPAASFKKENQVIDKYIEVLRSNSRVHNIKIKIYDTKYPEFMYKMFSGIINRIAKKQLQKGINDGVYQMFDQINKSIAEKKAQSDYNAEEKKIKEAKEVDKKRPDNWKSDAFNVQ